MELYLEKQRPERDYTTGQFLQGHRAVNKGIPRRIWMTKESDERVREMTRKRFREQKRAAGAGMPKRKVVCITDDGDFAVFAHAYEVVKRWSLKPNNRQNINRCCHLNAQHKANTNHRYMGLRWYFEDDDVWTTKIKRT